MGSSWCWQNYLSTHLCKALDADYYELSAVSAGKDDIRKIIENKDQRGSNKAKSSVFR